MAKSCERCSYSNNDDARFCHQCGGMLEASQDVPSGDPLIGKVLEGRYRVLSVLGEGGMGKVYLAEQRMGTTTRKVAIKTLHAELSSDPQLVERFNRECSTVVELTHPNTIKFYDFGELRDSKTLFIVMEYIEGESLAHTLRRGALPADRVDKLLIQIASCLQEAHQKGVVHRDLKPENVLLTSRGGQTEFVKVLDFGIAKRSEVESEREAKLTKQGMVLGTPPYMSPEQFSGQTLDSRSDIYSIGVMTYEMLTGRLPFEASTPWEWATMHLTQTPTPIDAHPSAALLPDHKKHAVMRCLAKNREERPATVIQFLQEFTGVNDPNAAWTFATGPREAQSFGGGGAASPPFGSAAQSPTGGTPRGPVGTPGPMHASQHGGHGYTPSEMQSYGGASYGSGELPMASSSAWKTGIVLLVVLMFFMLAGGAVGGVIWAFTKPTDTAPPVAAQRVVPPSNATGTVASAKTTTPTRTTPTTTTPIAITTTPNVEATPVPEEPALRPVHGSNIPEKVTQDPDPTPARHATGDAQLARGSAALANNDLAAAATALLSASRALGANHPRVRQLRSQLTAKGSTAIGVRLQQGDCNGAKTLFRALARAHAERQARVHFGDWCAL